MAHAMTNSLFAYFIICWTGSVTGARFPCTPVQPANPIPTDVRGLHPGHVSVVMAMGDSITAAFAEEGKIFEYRGDSWSGGKGSDDHWTLQYMIGKYNSSVVGGADTTTVPQLSETGYLEPKTDFLNVAISGSKSEYLLKEVKELQKQSARVDRFEERWKVLTILVGANDICEGWGACYTEEGGAAALAASQKKVADTYEANLDAALAKIRDSFTHIYVNVVSLFRITSPKRLRKGIKYCEDVHSVLGECECTDKPVHWWLSNVTEKQLDDTDATAHMLNMRIRSLVAKYNLQRPDFAVVAQVSGEGQDIPGMEYLSTFDCFHPSKLGQRLMAQTVWNGMFDRQRTAKPLKITAPFCPTPESTFFVAPKATEDLVTVV